jgi:hypothetical protein
MAKTSAELEKEFIASAKETTGRSIEQWLDLVKKSGPAGNKEIREWLKHDHHLNHMQAQFVTGMHFNNGKPVYINEGDLLEAQFQKSPLMRPLFESLVKTIVSKFPETKLIPKKTYLSFTAAREFAAVNVKPAELRLGLDLGDEPFKGRIQKSKLTGPMPRISHMLVISQKDEIDNVVIEFLGRSYQRTHNK